MKKLILIVTILSLSLSAETKWIPIEPTKSKETKKQNTQLPELQPVRKILKKAIVIKHLLDKQSVKDESSQESKKKWFLIK